jgi:fibronectin type 3 domain-containing protein
MRRREPPASLDASKRGGVVFLDWTPPFGMLPVFDPAQYNVYRATSPDGPFVLLAPISTATFVDRTAAAGATYYYVVTAVKPGVGEGPRSNRVRVSP